MREINDAAYNLQREVENEERVIVGVNRYVTEEQPISGLLKVDAELARQQVERLRQLRKERDGSAVKMSLARLEEVARGDDNTVPAILECVESYCTLGEICDVFRGIFGEQKEILAF